MIFSDIFIRKQTYIVDESIFYNNKKKLEVAEYVYHENADLNLNMNEDRYLQKNDGPAEQIRIGKFNIRQFYTSTDNEKVRIKLSSLITTINTLFINVFIIFKIFMSVVNLKKAKKNILEKVFYINRQSEAEANANANDSSNTKYNFNSIVGLKDEDNSKCELRNTVKRSFFIDNEKIRKILFANKESTFSDFNKKKLKEDKDFSQERVGNERAIQLDDFQFQEKYEGQINDSENNNKGRKVSFFESININNDNDISNIGSKKEESFQDIINKTGVENDLKNKMLINKNSNDNNSDTIEKYKQSNPSNTISVDDFNENHNKGKQRPNRDQKRPTMLSTIKKLFSSENKLTRKINMRTIFKMIICCKLKKINKIKKIYSFAEEKFDDYVNIQTYIKKMQDIESVKSILFNEDGETLFNFVSRPRISILFDENENIIHNKKTIIPMLTCQNYQENLYKKFLSINNKTSKTDLEKKLMQVFIEKLN